ncbi:GntR family transcriptional regulator [Limnobacter humi]|uniref:GntR family transcriptional regulator n=1 Tax=Limnobacter humi TaxID=1778671 RepID=A0ABT1WCF8_9BURK|nr:GntR family transcriptional regulator [Limnobacter humi]MCQ8895200.1 GntR family transcriptional regulator [Limnobacter humi]
MEFAPALDPAQAGDSKLDPNQVVPLYHQIYLILREQIIEGHYDTKPLPGELVLAEQFNVSRVTMRRALQDLVKEGLVARGRGKGTFVKPRSEARSHSLGQSQLLSASAMRLQASGDSSDLQLITSKRIIPPPDIATLLHLPSDAIVEKLIRIRELNGQPVAHLTSFIPQDLSGRLCRRRLREFPILVLLEEAGVKVAKARQTISARLADASVAYALGVPVGAPLLAISRVAYDETGRPVQVLKGLYRPDRYDYRIELSRKQVKGQSSWQHVNEVEFAFEMHQQDITHF